MSGSVNKVFLVGHLGKDPEMRSTASGDAIASFSLATSESWKDKSGVKQEKTEWHDLVAFGKVAEIIGNYVKKGSLIHIIGKLQTDKYTDNQGIERYKTKIVVSEMTMLGSKSEGSGAPAPKPTHSVQDYSPPQHQAVQPARYPNKRRDVPPPQSAPKADFDDDIPF